MSTLMPALKSALRFFGELDRESVQQYATDRADGILSNYGYSRGPSAMTQVVTHVTSFGVGMAVGTGLGMLLAPRSGEETREKLSELGQEGLEKVTAVLNDLSPTTETPSSEMRSEMQRSKEPSSETHATDESKRSSLLDDARPDERSLRVQA